MIGYSVNYNTTGVITVPQNQAITLLPTTTTITFPWVGMYLITLQMRFYKTLSYNNDYKFYYSNISLSQSSTALATKTVNTRWTNGLTSQASQSILLDYIYLTNSTTQIVNITSLNPYYLIANTASTFPESFSIENINTFITYTRIA